MMEYRRDYTQVWKCPNCDTEHYDEPHREKYINIEVAKRDPETGDKSYRRTGSLLQYIDHPDYTFENYKYPCCSCEYRVKDNSPKSVHRTKWHCGVCHAMYNTQPEAQACCA